MSKDIAGWRNSSSNNGNSAYAVHGSCPSGFPGCRPLPCARQATPRENHMPMTAAAARPPSKFLLLAEGRAVWEAGATLALWPLLQFAPRGDGHTVIVLPGLGASDGSTEMLRKFLETRGYRVEGWGLGTNCGP